MTKTARVFFIHGRPVWNEDNSEVILLDEDQNKVKKQRGLNIYSARDVVEKLHREEVSQ